uniref:NADP-dependent oxidoreductase domain-containing protein n=1 Tax=Meloidogyne enterolobii TaxID=390850 RepID=A0A6V7TLM2_MELEN|nr:unnamed protein product [Meloidogyne enterolobii]
MTATKILKNQKGEGGPKVLLNSGHLIPLIGLGTYKIVDQTLMDSSVDAALKCGYRFFDTAKLYQNEKQLGNSLEKLLPKYGLNREDVFLLTKFSPFPAEKASEEVPKLIEESLENLKTNYIDLVLIHCPKPDENKNEDKEGNSASRKINWQALENLSEEKVHSIGVSNYEVCHLEEMNKYLNKKPAVNQIEFHPHFRRNDIREFCKNEGIHLQAFSPMARQQPELLNDPVVKRITEEHKTTPQKVLLSFAISQGIGVVPKSSNPEWICSNFDSLDLKLTVKDLDELNNIPINKNYIRPTPWLVL